MSVPVFILTLASAVTVIGLFAPGWSDLLLIGPPAAIAALVLLLRFFCGSLPMTATVIGPRTSPRLPKKAT